MTNDKHDGTSDELVEADLPGLDDADFPDETPEPPAELSDLEKFDRAVKEWEDGLDAKAASKASAESWTDAELERWWDRTNIGKGGISRHQKRFLRQFFADDSIDVDDEFRPVAPDGGVGSGLWPLMSHEAKVRFRRAWDEMFPPKPKKSTDHDIPYEDSDLTEMPSYLSMFEDDVDSMFEDDASPESELLSSMETEDKKFDAARWAVPGEGYEESPRASIPRGIWIGGGVGVLGLVLAIGFFTFSGSDVSDPATVVEDVPAIAVTEEPAATVEDQPTAAVAEEPVTAIEEEPTPPVEEVPTLAVEGPGCPRKCHLRNGVGRLERRHIPRSVLRRALADRNPCSGRSLEHAGPCRGSPPTSCPTQPSGLFMMERHEAQRLSWGDVQASIDGEMRVTPKGTLVVKLPGLSPTGGLAAANLTSAARLTWLSQVILEEGDDIQRWDGDTTLGEIAQLTEPLPLLGWIPVATDFGPVTLIVPTGLVQHRFLAWDTSESDWARMATVDVWPTSSISTPSWPN